jgi:hypothetical protein
LEGGVDSIPGLIRRRFPNRKAEEVLAWMETNRVIVRQKDDSFALADRAVVISDSEAIAMEMMATLATQYLDTALNNFRSKDRRHRNFGKWCKLKPNPSRSLSMFGWRVETHPIQTNLPWRPPYIRTRIQAHAGPSVSAVKRLGFLQA